MLTFSGNKGQQARSRNTAVLSGRRTMKNTLKGFMVFLLFLLGCNKHSTESSNNPAVDIIGKWEMGPVDWDDFLTHKGIPLAIDSVYFYLQFGSNYFENSLKYFNTEEKFTETILLLKGEYTLDSNRQMTIRITEKTEFIIALFNGTTNVQYFVKVISLSSKQLELNLGSIQNTKDQNLKLIFRKIY